MYSALLKTLERLAAGFKGLDATSVQSVRKLEKGVGRAIELVPPQLPDLREMLCLAEEGAKALGGKDQAEALKGEMQAALYGAIKTAFHFFVEGNEATCKRQMKPTADRLRALLKKCGRASGKTPAKQKQTPAETPALTLDDVAALIVQAEPKETGELKTAARALKQLLSSRPEDDPAREYLSKAAGRIESLVAGKSADPNADLKAAGDLLESAQRNFDQREEGKKTSSGKEQPVKASPSAHVPPVTRASNDVAEVTKNAGTIADTPDVLPADADLDLMGEFVTESREYIEAAEAALLTLETNPEDIDSVNTVFRAFHTIKGTAAYLDLPRMSELAHRAESLLSRVRDNEIRCTGGYADLCLRSIDVMKGLIDGVQTALTGQPMMRPEGYDDLLEVLADPEASGMSEEDSEASPEPPRLGDLLVAQGQAAREEVEEAASNRSDEPIGVAIVKSGTASLADVAKALRTQQRMAGSEQAVDSSVRVSTERLDRLIDMVGELVIAHSLISHDEVIISGVEHVGLLRKVSHAGKIIRELQDLSMSMRMVPLKATFQKMSRLVRDLSKKSGKDIALITDDKDTEIDRNMVDVINDLLVHMVRNSVDHGIEPPEARVERGKSRTGRISLSAYHSGGNVVVEIEDDGRGLDREKILQKAVSKGIIDSGKILTDGEVFNLIFEPGFSTAEKVTDISGRGVGMDVVRKGVESLRGRIDVTSQPGHGTTFSLRLPLTLAITDGMAVKVGEQRYIVPTVNIHLSFRPDAGAISRVAGKGEIVMLRGELMPLFRLHTLLEVEGAIEDPTQGLLVIVDDGERRCALLVDELLGQQQVVTKSLGEGFDKVSGIAGGAILGDGKVGLILDPAELVALAKHSTESGSARGAKYRSAA